MSRYGELTAKVDAFFARVVERHAAELACDSGCSDCCHARLTITAVEAAAIRDELATWEAPRRAAVHALASRPDDGRCAALDGNGRCTIYAVRPIVCRSHGAPIRMRDARSLPVIQSCYRNFAEDGPASADPDCVIDQTTLSAMTLAVAREAGFDPAERIALAELVVAASGPSARVGDDD